MEQLCIFSFLQNGHPFHLYTYGKVENIPEGVIVCDAAKILPADKIFKYKENNSYAGFANLFRYKLLLEKGNYWVDTDMICLKPLENDDEHIFAFQRDLPTRYRAGKIRLMLYNIRNITFDILSFLRKNKCKEEIVMVNNCIIKAPKNSEVMNYCYREAAKKNPDDLKWGQTGPALLTEAVGNFEMWDSVAKPDVFCSFNWWECGKLLRKSKNYNFPANSQAVHMWNEMWRRNRINKSIVHHKYSIYEQLKRKYLNPIKLP